MRVIGDAFREELLLDVPVFLFLRSLKNGRLLWVGSCGDCCEGQASCSGSCVLLKVVPWNSVVAEPPDTMILAKAPTDANEGFIVMITNSQRVKPCCCYSSSDTGMIMND